MFDVSPNLFCSLTSSVARASGDRLSDALNSALVRNAESRKGVGSTFVDWTADWTKGHGKSRGGTSAVLGR